MQLCEAKHCWLHDLEKIPAEELPYWIAYYQLEEERRNREEKKAKAKAALAKMKGKRH